MLAVFKGVEIDPFKPFDFEGDWLSLENLVDFTRYFGSLLANCWQVDLLVDLLNKQLIFQLIYPIDIYCEYYPKLKTAALSAVRKGLGEL